MMRRRVVIPALLLAALTAPPALLSAQYGTIGQVPVADSSQRYSAQQIDNLAGPVALYPDALLAQVLIASTFPEQIEDAADFVRTYGTDSIDVQGWDVSVKAVAHYPSALNAMADKIDWTAALGKAYATQSSDVMASVQRLRRMAADQGNLQSTAEQKIVTVNDTYQIVPVQTRVIYVPVYDPYVIYSRPVFNVGYSSRYWSFGVGFPIGGWLMYDCDWGLRRVYYNGWSPSYYAFGGGWRARSRPFIQITNVYISPRYANVYVNHNINTRSVNYYNVDRYASVHSGRHFETRHDGRYDSRDNGNSNSRYAVRRDGNNGSGAVAGGGYRGPNSGTATDGSTRPQDNRNAPRGGNNRTGARDGSGYGGNSGSRGASNSANGGRNGNSGGNTSAGNVGFGGGVRSTDQGGGNNRAAVPPAQRRSEPGTRTSYGPQIIVPQRQGDSPGRAQQPSQTREAQPRPGQPRAQQPVFTPQTRQAPPQQRAAPARSEPQRAAPAPVVRPQQRSAPASTSGSTRTARRRGGDN